MMSWLSAVLIEAALQREARGFLVGAEVAERQVAGFAAVSGVGAVETERPDHEPQRSIGRRRRRPGDVAAERAAEAA